MEGFQKLTKCEKVLLLHVRARYPRAYKAQKKASDGHFKLIQSAPIRNDITKPYVKAYNFLPNVLKEGGVWFNGFLNNVRKNCRIGILGHP